MIIILKWSGKKGVISIIYHQKKNTREPVTSGKAIC